MVLYTNDYESNNMLGYVKEIITCNYIYVCIIFERRCYKWQVAQHGLFLIGVQGGLFQKNDLSLPCKRWIENGITPTL